MSERSLFVKLNESEVSQVKALSREYRLPMEEILRRMVVNALEQLEAEGKAPENLPAEERQRLAFEAARREVEEWRAEF